MNLPVEQTMTEDSESRITRRGVVRTSISVALLAGVASQRDHAAELLQEGQPRSTVEHVSTKQISLGGETLNSDSL